MGGGKRKEDWLLRDRKCRDGDWGDGSVDKVLGVQA